MNESSPHEVFEQFVAALDQPVYVVTTAVRSERAGCLVGFAMQSSIDPPRFLVGLSVANHTFRVANDADHLAVHLLPTEASDLADLFGGETGDEVDKFARCSWHEGPHGLPVLDGAIAWLCGRILDRVPLGDHTGFVLEPVGGSGPTGAAEVMTISDVGDLAPGHDA
ncbi:flavin reductase family protein [Rhodococcus gannanensis]|uniref:Flavin reductase family protein n=1 Tax=Rhodococcus gannanensis TaxID=1960308 RepID=A0ABW4P9U4_9NOCA